MFKPVGVVTPQGDIQRQNIFHFIGMYRLIANRRARGGKAVQEGFMPFFWRTGEEIRLGRFKNSASHVALRQYRRPTFSAADGVHTYPPVFIRSGGGKVPPFA
jgi:hypothetical protein